MKQTVNQKRQQNEEVQINTERNGEIFAADDAKGKYMGIVLYFINNIKLII